MSRLSENIWMVDVDAKDIEGETPLHVAVFVDNKEIVELLLSKVGRPGGS
jgi:ankyrin repeat protein